MNSVWIFSGVDPVGAAGFIVDIRTLHAFAVPARGLPTALTAQSHREVRHTEPVNAETLRTQWETLGETPRFVKLGMLGNAAAITALARWLPNSATVVCDPVRGASSGGKLIDPTAETALRELLFPKVSLLTPNLPEASALLGYAVDSPATTERAAEDLLRLGVKAVLIKGGHRNNDLARDYFTDGRIAQWWESPRRPVRARGTGCTLASAIAAGLARQQTMPSAIAMAKLYLNRELRESNGDPAVLDHRPWDEAFIDEDLPKLRERLSPPDGAFSRAENLGLYAIVDRAHKIPRLAEAGIRTVQLRTKDLRGEDLDREIRSAVKVAREKNLFLYVNDFWELALAAGAPGVHLGQSDLIACGRSAISILQRAGMYLGVSTHDYEELARAKSVRPSYVALGPIYPTTTKVMPFVPQGIANLKRWRNLTAIPLVAIGGMTRTNTTEVWRAGADGVAVLSALDRMSPREISEWQTER